MDGASRLLRLAGLAQELGAEPVAEEARDLAARVSEGRFYVACVGQFKRGKSTLLNALVGHEVVPTGFIPVTAVPTVIRFGDKLHARVRMRDASWRDVAMPDLKEYVTEELNPENKKARGRRGSLCTQPFVVLRHVFCGHAGFGLSLYRKYGDHAGIHSSHRCSIGGGRSRPADCRRGIGAGGGSRQASSGLNPGDQQS